PPPGVCRGGRGGSCRAPVWRRKPARAGSGAGLTPPRQAARAAATSGRPCSAGGTDFFCTSARAGGGPATRSAARRPPRAGRGTRRPSARGGRGPAAGAGRSGRRGRGPARGGRGGGGGAPRAGAAPAGAGGAGGGDSPGLAPPLLEPAGPGRADREGFGHLGRRHPIVAGRKDTLAQVHRVRPHGKPSWSAAKVTDQETTRYTLLKSALAE